MLEVKEIEAIEKAKEIENKYTELMLTKINEHIEAAKTLVAEYTALGLTLTNSEVLNKYTALQNFTQNVAMQDVMREQQTKMAAMASPQPIYSPSNINGQ